MPLICPTFKTQDSDPQAEGGRGREGCTHDGLATSPRRTAPTAAFPITATAEV